MSMYKQRVPIKGSTKLPWMLSVNGALFPPQEASSLLLRQYLYPSSLNTSEGKAPQANFIACWSPIPMPAYFLQQLAPALSLAHELIPSKG